MPLPLEGAMQDAKDVKTSVIIDTLYIYTSLSIAPLFLSEVLHTMKDTRESQIGAMERYDGLTENSAAVLNQ